VIILCALINVFHAPIPFQVFLCIIFLRCLFLLLFLLTKQELYRELIYDGINVDVMHAERSAAQREEVIRRFRAGEIWVLICTDLMARGV